MEDLLSSTPAIPIMDPTMPPTTTVPPPYKENAERCLASEFNFKNGPEDSFQTYSEL